MPLHADALKSALQQSAVPSAVAFVRVGSAPSAQLLASLAEVEGSFAARLTLRQLDMDAAPELVQELRIHKVPELLVWAPGGARLLGRMEGGMSARQLVDWLEHVCTRA